MSERELQDAVIKCARTFGWRVAHFRTSMNKRGGYQTAVAADGTGYPDLTLVREGHLIFAELKAAKGRVSDAQRVWLDALGAVTFGVNRVQVYEWRPEQWLDGTIEQVLR